MTDAEKLAGTLAGWQKAAVEAMDAAATAYLELSLLVAPKHPEHADWAKLAAMWADRLGRATAAMEKGAGKTAGK